jgi:hypothetical protein
MEFKVLGAYDIAEERYFVFQGGFAQEIASKALGYKKG